MSPPGPGPCEGEGGIAGRTPSGSGDSWRQKREEAGRRPGAGGRRAPAWAERSGRGLSGANRPSGRACAEMRARGGRVQSAPTWAECSGRGLARRTAPQTAPALRCGPGRALCARVGGAQWAGPAWGGSPLRPRLRRDADPCTSGSWKPRAGYMCLWLLRRPRRFCVQSQGPSRLLRAAVPESNRHVQALGWVWYGCEASRHSSRLLRESRVRGDG